jgi:hypothetical protein
MSLTVSEPNFTGEMGLSNYVSSLDSVISACQISSCEIVES